MKPNFILEMSHEGIRLRAAADGSPKEVVGEVALSDAEFERKVVDLRNEVAEKSDAPLATELRIPDSEILYTTLDDPEADPEKPKVSRDTLREKAVRDALEGMTPYALADLNYIWKVKGKGELCVAAVAHETLAEAEEFATSRGFNPVSFVARPAKGKYAGIADFGPTKVQATRIAAAQRAREEAEIREREEAAVKAEAEAKARARAREEAALAAKAKAEAKTPPETADAAKPPDAPDTPPAPPSPPKDAGQTDSPDKPRAPAAADESGPSAAPPLAGAGAMAPSNGKAPPTAAADAADMPRVGFSRPRVNDPLSPLDESAAAATAAPPPATPARPAPPKADEIIDDVPPMPVAFASRRKNAASAATAKSTAAGALAPGAATPPADFRESRLTQIAARFSSNSGAKSLSGGAVPPPPPRRTPGAGSGALANGAAAVVRGSADKPGMPAPRPASARVSPAVALPDTSDAAASLSPVTDAQGNLLDGRERAAVSARLATGRTLNEAEAMTVFGARDALPERSFRPVLIGLVIAALLAVAVWAALAFLGNDQSGDSGADLPEDTAALITADPVAEPAAELETTESVPVPPPPAQAAPADEPQPSPGTDIAALPDTARQPEGESDAPARGTGADSTIATLGPTALDVPTADGLPSHGAPPLPLDRDPLQRPPSEATGEDGIVARYATTGIWEAPPDESAAPDADRLDDLYIASIDPALPGAATGPRQSLPELSSPVPPLPLLPPAPAGQDFDLDENGLVRATPDGALSPQGILITAGAPTVAPPTRPERPGTPAPAAETQPDLPDIRPRTRPGDLAQDEEDQTLLDTAEVTRLATVKPRTRPADVAEQVAEMVALSVQERAAAAAAAVAGASTATPQAPLNTPQPRPAPEDLAALAPEPAALAAAASVLPPDSEISPFAVARSRLPRDRPDNFQATVVARAQVQPAPTPQAAPAQQPTRVAAPAAVVTPNIPSRASVAQQATVKDAINLGRMNLIGVYGSTSNRRALVRLPTGRFVKVKVGDNVDGGRVAAIGQSDLRYTKGGRQVVLSMPSG